MNIIKEWTNRSHVFLPVRLRAVAVKQYEHFTLCRVEAYRDGEWEYVYPECFDMREGY